MEEYLAPSQCIDSDHPRVVEFAKTHTMGLKTDVEKACALYYQARDSVLYDPYNLTLNPEDFRASHILETRRTFCIPKAVLLAALARAVNIPARLGFADVINHLSTPRLIKMLRSEVFSFHGYTELFLEGKWVKATPAFNRHICRLFNVNPLEFDGKTDSIFHEYSNDGRKYMTYLKDHGQFVDVPFELLEQNMRKHYPHFLEEGFALAPGEPDQFEKGLVT